MVRPRPELLSGGAFFFAFYFNVPYILLSESFFMSSAVDAFFDVNTVAERIAFIAYI